MSELETNLNVYPYHDDFDENKQFYRILFVPKHQVQVRELNQLQTQFQSQIKRFGDHIFKDGSVVDGCNITHIPAMNYVRMVDTFVNTGAANTAFDVTLENCLAVSNTGLRAAVKLVKPGYQLQYPDTNVLYVDYLNTGRDVSNNEVSVFRSNETLTIYAANQDKHANVLDPNKIYNTINTITANTSANVATTGVAYGMTVGEGIVYQKGFFVKVLPHTIAVRDYDVNVEPMLVGFNTLESIVNYLQDESLRDPVTNNARNAPGADRLKLVPRLVSIDKSTITNESSFFPLVQFNVSKPVQQNLDPAYAALGDYIGRGIYEGDGDFYIKPFIVGSASHANTSLFNYTVNPGTAYVRGNRVELIGAINLPTERATTTAESNASVTTLNYGNYVLVNELVGMFDHRNAVTVTIYDAAQDSITDLEGSTSGPTGAVVGTATLRSIMYNDGTKGTAEATYRFYLTNIKMNSGKSFATDAKSFYATGSLGNAKADLVLEGGRAVIQDSVRSSLIFPTGASGLRRLRDVMGNNDTQFYTKDIVSGTLQSNGSVTYTLRTPHAGGIERFFSSVGSISTANELRVDMVMGAAAASQNLAGTVNSTTTGNTITGTGTSFTSFYKPGQQIQVVNGANNTIRRVLSVANNTSMLLDGPMAMANTAAVHRRYFTAGQVVDMTDNVNVMVNSNTQFTVNFTSLTFPVGAPQTTYASYPVFRSQSVEAKKLVKKSRFVKIDCSSNTVGPWNLGLTDIASIEAVYVGTTYSESNPDRKSWFTLDNGQSETHYDHGKLAINPAFKGKISPATRISAKVTYFEANSTTGIGFFSVDSYPVRGPGVSANTTNISYAEIPSYGGISLRDAVDFRPRKYNTAADATTLAAASINPAASNNSFVVSASGLYLPEPDSNFQADMEFYLPRRDIVQVNKDGVFSVKASVPAINPVTPIADGDATTIATTYVPPYPSLPSDEVYSQNSDKIVTNLAGNRNYTKRDIGVLDQRISRLEYTSALSMLEQQAKEISVKDEDGLDRFKNGIFANPFKNHLLGNVSNFEYSIAVDERLEIARPKIKRTEIDLTIGDLRNVVTNGQTAKLPFTNELFIEQPYASKFRNATQSVWNWAGTVSLYPSYDFAKDEISVPDVNITIDLASPWAKFADSTFSQSFGDWSTTTKLLESNSSQSSSVTSATSGRTTTTSTSTTTTTSDLIQSTSTRNVSTLNVSSSQTTYDLGNSVTDVTLNPFMRSREVAFIATGLKPNTKFWTYFDGVAVSAHCAPGAATSKYDTATKRVLDSSGKESDIVSRTGNWGTQLVSDAAGNVFGIFRIPDSTFKVGDRKFIIANVDNITTGKDGITSSANFVYTASSLSVSTKNTSLSVIDPILNVSTTTDVDVKTSTNVTSSTNTTVSTVSNPAATPPANNPGSTPAIVIPTAPENLFRERGERSNGGGNGGDPLAQSFLSSTPDNSIPGFFLPQIDLFFKSKDQNLGITVYITEMEAGVPNSKRIVGSSYRTSATVNVSDDASVATSFYFENTPYFTADKYYAFYAKPDGDSPEYLVWMAEIGSNDVVTGNQIFSNPYIGTAFLSANSETWTPLQTEDIKFRIYRCKFTSASGLAYFYDQNDDYFTVNGFSMANSSVNIQVGDIVYTQNSSGGVLTSNVSPRGVVQFVDRSRDLLILDSSTGGFVANTTIQIHRPASVSNVSGIGPATQIANTVIKSIDNVPYSVVVPKITTITPTGTTAAISFAGMDSSETFDTAWTNMQGENEKEFLDKMRVVKSKSNRSAVDQSIKYAVSLNTTSDFISPMIDLRRTASLMIENLVNNDVTNEHTRYGNSLTRFVSLNVVLKDGQDAEDIKVYVTGYRPDGTDIHCYVKILNAGDPDVFENKLWTKLNMSEGNTTFSNSLDPTDFREYGYSFPSTEGIQGQAYLNQSTGIVEYRDALGSIYSSYKTFAIKLVLTSDRAERVPRVDSMFGICLQI